MENKTRKTASNEGKTVVMLPECAMKGRVCGDCVRMDTYDTDSFGQCYCGYRKKYFPAGSGAGSCFVDRDN